MWALSLFLIELYQYADIQPASDLTVGICGSLACFFFYLTVGVCGSSASFFLLSNRGGVCGNSSFFVFFGVTSPLSSGVVPLPHEDDSFLFFLGGVTGIGQLGGKAGSRGEGSSLCLRT